MKKLKFTHSCDLSMDDQVIGHYFTLRITPCDDDAQHVVIDECHIEPLAQCVSQVDGWGNLLCIGDCTDAHSSFSYRVSGTAVVDSTKGRGSELNLGYCYPSSLTQPGQALRALHAAQLPFDASGHSAVEIFDRAVELCAAVHEAMVYDSQATDVTTTAEQALSQGRGVCQDYAHILCALLRMSGIPARYVSGLMWGEGATHAWVEFYDGATWWGLDPTNNCEAGDYYIALARGRDHSDCPMESGVFRGSANQEQLVKVSVEVLED